MLLRNIKFKNVWCSSGTRNIFGQGYWYSKYFDYSQTTFVAKTITLYPCKGNLPIDNLGNVKNIIPKCIKVDFIKGTVLNAVGLSNPGLEHALAENIWQQLNEPFVISFMAISECKNIEYKYFFERIAEEKFKSSLAIELNLSCPNVNHKNDILEIMQMLDDYHLPYPLILNFSVAFDPEFVMEVANHPQVDAISIANTIKYGYEHPSLNWKDKSPLEEFGGGGLSGKPLLPILLENLEKLKIKKPIVAGGGILSREAAQQVICASSNVQAIKLGTIGILRPWRLAETIKLANKLL